MSFQVGDTVQIGKQFDHYLMRWEGFEAQVERDTVERHNLWLRPLTDRPDGNKRECFYWPVADLSLTGKGVRDADGKPLRVGDRIAYPGRRGSAIWLNFGEVVGIKTEPHPWRDGITTVKLKVAREARHKWETDGRLVTVQGIGHVVRI